MLFSMHKQSAIIYHDCYAKGLSKNLLLTPLIQSCSKKIFIQNQIKTATGIYGNIEIGGRGEREREGEGGRHVKSGRKREEEKIEFREC